MRRPSVTKKTLSRYTSTVQAGSTLRLIILLVKLNMKSAQVLVDRFEYPSISMRFIMRMREKAGFYASEKWME